jgi:hypothetical protein
LEAIGNGGSGLGYENLTNALSIEMDTFFNYENLDLYENHISVQTQGFRDPISANHSRSLAATTRIPDLTNGPHTVRIRYDPNFDVTAITHESFKVSGQSSYFLEVQI